MFVAVREVTQPVHGADGRVVHRPGERFAQDVVLAEGVPWKWAVAEVPDRPPPVPGPEAAPAKAAKAETAGKES